MENILRDSGGAYQCTHIICLFPMVTPEKTQICPRKHLHFVACKYVLTCTQLSNYHPAVMRKYSSILTEASSIAAVSAPVQ